MTARRLLVYPPGHPALLGVYVVLAVVLAFLASTIVFEAASLAGEENALLYSNLVAALILLSPAMSFLNIVLGEVEHGEDRLTVEIEFVVAYGLPIPVPRLKVSRRRTIIAVNVGGALIPVVISIILFYLLYERIGPEAVTPVLAAVIVTSIVTFIAARPIPGIGIVVPALLPPLVSSTVAVLYMGGGVYAGITAYIGGALGSLIGADLLRFLRDLEKLQAPIVSIGGAGVFDGTYLSALLGFILAY